MKKRYMIIMALITTTCSFALDTKNTRFTESYCVEYFDIQKQNNQGLKNIKASYNDGKLTIFGLEKTVDIAIYNLLGRKVVAMKNIAITENFSTNIDLPKHNIYIVKITFQAASKTFKIVSN